MNKNFIYKSGSEVLFGKVINLPKNVKDNEIIERIKAHDYLHINDSSEKEVSFIDDDVKSPNLEIDWTAEYEPTNE